VAVAWPAYTAKCTGRKPSLSRVALVALPRRDDSNNCDMSDEGERGGACLDAVPVAIAERREMQGSAAIAIARSRIGAAFDEHLNRARFTAECRVVQRRAARRGSEEERRYRP
jgi:hypothetical protein